MTLHRSAPRRAIAWRVTLLMLAIASPAQALFHLSLIDEIMASHDGDDSVQFVEIHMPFASQNVIKGAVIAVFDANGNYLEDAIVFPLNVANGEAGARFIVGTPSFVTVSGLTPDFTMAADLPPNGGMVCFGGGGATLPLDPDSWDRTDLETYVDCLAYGDYVGPLKIDSGDPTLLVPVGHSLVRVSDSDDNATDFDCGDPATPQNNLGMSVPMDATIVFCPEPQTALAQLAVLASLAWLQYRRRRSP